MKITLEFSEHDLRGMVSDYLAKKALVPQGMTSSTNFKIADKGNGIVACVTITTPEPSSGYLDR